MLFKEIIPVYRYTENLTKPTSTKHSVTIKVCGVYSNHWALKGYITSLVAIL
jgi:hypothetical protein